MLDRVIRQGSFDAARSEMLLYGDAGKILNRKADRIAAILDEISAEFYANDKLQALDYRDWTIRRCNESLAGKARSVLAQIAGAAADKLLSEKIAKLRQALAEYRQAAGKLDRK